MGTLSTLFGGSHGSKTPPAGSYGPAEGPPDAKMLKRMRDHWKDDPQCSGAWAEHHTFSTTCVCCSKHI